MTATQWIALIVMGICGTGMMLWEPTEATNPLWYLLGYVVSGWYILKDMS